MFIDFSRTLLYARNDCMTDDGFALLNLFQDISAKNQRIVVFSFRTIHYQLFHCYLHSIKSNRVAFSFPISSVFPML